MSGSGLICILQGRRPRGGAELENPNSGSCFHINQLGDPEPRNHMCSLQAYFLSGRGRDRVSVSATTVLVINTGSQDPAPGVLFSKWSGPRSLHDGYEPLRVGTRGLWSLGSLISQPPSSYCFYEPLLLSSHCNRYCTSLGDTFAIKL